MNRRERRVAEAHSRKLARSYRAAVQLHKCVLNEDAVRADVRVELSPIEHHMFHAARGESKCPACPVCAKAGATRYEEHELSELREAWDAKLSAARFGQ